MNLVGQFLRYPLVMLAYKDLAPVNLKITVIIPCYRTKDFVLDVIKGIGQEVSSIIVVDDFCPDGTGEFVTENCLDPRVIVLRNLFNMGVGGAVMRGYQAAIYRGADILIKIDGDGQMNPSLIPVIISPIISGNADYVKGNRFFDLKNIHSMPPIRIFGNAVLSFMSKLSTGYWNIFDPTNGFTALHANIATRLPFEKISSGYFFESDILFRLNLLRAVVVDMPMDSKYGNEYSNLRINKIIFEFAIKHVRNFIKRIIYHYYLRDMSIASLELMAGLLMFISGLIFGLYNWVNSSIEGSLTPSGTVMLAALPILMGTQLILAFLSYDIANVPHFPLLRTTHTRVHFNNSN